MIIESDNTIKAFDKAKANLLALVGPLDPELVSESPIQFIFTDLDKDISIPIFDGNKYLTAFNYQESFNMSTDFVQKEFNHYEKLLNKQIINLIGYLKENSLSKRAIINVWDNSQIDLSAKAECLVYIFSAEPRMV